MSSIRHNAFSSPARTFDIYFWKCSGALVIPKGNLLKQYLPIGVIKVDNGLDSFSNGICQNPLIASSPLKIVAPDN